jgi:hypothetical protein
MNPVIKMGNERVLTETDMPELPKVDTAEHLRDLAQVCALCGRGKRRRSNPD